MRQVPKISSADLAFGSIQHLPKMEEIPEEFKNGRTEWNKIFERWFYKGLPSNTKFVPKTDVDTDKAISAIRAIMISYAPKHEHKSAGVAYLLSEWFDKIELE